ncbi:MAG: pantetheine-phosphate adenylyltransferase [bacterium]
MKKVRALYPGTFDPLTLGHLDILKRGLTLFDEVIVAVARGGDHCLFSLAERVALGEAACRDLAHCAVVPFRGLLVDEVDKQQAVAVIRGMRSVTDYTHEWSLASANRRLRPSCETVCLLARPELACVSSSVVRDIARHGGDVSSFVAPAVADALQARFAEGST